jgi:hypothetical protein
MLQNGDSTAKGVLYPAGHPFFGMVFPDGGGSKHFPASIADKL